MIKHTDRTNYLLTVDDLGELLSPFFNLKIGRVIGKSLIKVLRVDTLNKIHSDCVQYEKYDVPEAILRDKRVAVTYTLHNKEVLDNYAKEGPFFTVSNHPFGGLDGIILIDIMSKVRSDYMVLVNGFLRRITALNDFWIPVVPNSVRREHDPSKNINGIRLVANRLQEGHPVGLFPAGGLPHYNKLLGCPVEMTWKMSIIRMINMAQIPIIPIMFEGNNSKRYYRFGERYGYSSASLLIPKELVNKRGKNIDVYVGDPILPADILPFESDLTSLRNYIMREALGVLPSYQSLFPRLTF